jgi:hypothetical protein
MNKKLWYLLVLAALFYFAGYVNAISWTALNYPGAKETYITGIDGDTIVGYYSYYDSFTMANSGLKDPHGFIYDGKTWRTLDCPRVLESSLIEDTMIEGIDNGNIVGNCYSRISRYPNGSSGEDGFIYDGHAWRLLNFPGARNTYVQAIEGSNIAGYYTDAAGEHGFFYNGTNWNTLLYPWVSEYTHIAGISGNNVAINHFYNPDGVIYNLDSQTWSTIEFPGEDDFTRVLAIDGSNILGWYGEVGERGNYFLYDGLNWTTLDFPSIYLFPNSTSYFASKAVATIYINDMDGDDIVGYYKDGTGVHGFAATIPEPMTLALLAFGGLLLRKRKL